MRLSAARVVTPSGTLSPGAVEIDHGVITSIGPTTTAPDVTLAPGFVDIQVNGIGDINVADAAGADWERLDDMLLAQGVTAWCPTLISQPLDKYATELERIAEAASRPTGPKILGAHLEGPFLGGAPGAHDRSALVPIDQAWLRNLPGIVRLITLAPELPGAADAVRTLTRRGITVSLGHSTASAEEATKCVDAGATVVTHCFNGMGPFHHRQPGLLGAALTDDRLTVSLIADLVHVDAAALRLAWKAKGPERVILVTDSVAPGRATVRDGAPRLPDGTLAGSCLAMDVAIGNLVHAAGVPLHHAVRAASTNPADLLGERGRGRIEVGCRADLAVLDGDLRISATYLGGVQVA